METVSHRDMRNHSGALLRRIEAGDTVVVTSRGRPVAIVSPVGTSPLDDLEHRGQLRRAARPAASVADIPRQRSDVASSAIIDDARGRW